MGRRKSSLSWAEKVLIELTGERGRRVDVPGMCIEHPTYLQLQKKGFVKTDDLIIHGKIIHWELTDKGERKYVRLLKDAQAQSGSKKGGSSG